MQFLFPVEFPAWLAVTESLVFGLLFGSFLNVVIHRVPRGESIVTPRSRCPKCGHAIAWYENIPVASYLALRGRCRECKAAISPRYALVELLVGVLFAALMAMSGWGLPFVKYAFFACLMVALAFIDLEHRILPDVITYPGIIGGLIFSLFLPVGDGTAAFALPVLARWPVIASAADAALGAFAGGGLLWLIGEVYYRVRHVEGMGFGDVKLMALVGAFLGLKLALLTIFLGAAAGSIIGAAYIWLQGKGRAYELPFGTFLGFMAIFAAVWGKELVLWYLSATF